MAKHILKAEQFADRELLGDIFSEAAKYQLSDDLGIRLYRKALADKCMAALFYEPSTRTRFSFEEAAQKLGAHLLSSESAAKFSSAIKGESIEDTIRVVQSYADFIVMRHPEVGAADRAAAVASVPIINAGDGNGQHPTQALLDFYTIKRELGTLDGLNVAMVGDLLNGRTIHSLIQLLETTKHPMLYLVAPEQLKLPEKYRRLLDDKGIPHVETTDLNKALPDSDVVYMTRVQKERFKDERDYEALKDAYILRPEGVDRMPKKSIVMHPLPRVNEISTDVDNSPKAAYFRQAQNGLYVRMALLSYLADSMPKRPGLSQMIESIGKARPFFRIPLLG